jgi:hemerythrin-like metal-binding protein
MATFKFEIDPATLNFDSHLASGNSQIDQEHRQLLDSARQLLAASSGGKNAREIQEMLDGLVHDMAVHFAHEDQQMIQSGWSEAAQHAGIHQLLMLEAKRLVEKHRANMASFLDIYRFVVGTMVRDHLAIHDLEFHHYLQKQSDN